ncbi:MAG: sulfatase-like hydrolase/transferase [Planctomycetota bacterium]
MLLATIAAGLASCLHGPAPTACADDRPNIVLFLVDDLGQQDVSVPMLAERSALNARFRTPNLERLAARGVRCSNAYAAAPVCTPSRTAILTGQSPARTHITYWTLRKDTDQSSPHERLLPPAWEMNGLQPSPEVLPDLLPERLRAAGYATIHAGKAHWGALGTDGSDPLRMGFERNIAGHAAGAPGSFLGTDHFKEDAARKRGRIDPAQAAASVWDVPGLERWHGKDVWLDDAIAREACDALSAAVASGKPFFLSFCPYGVHTPIMADPRFAGDFAGLDPTERAYATMVAAVDEALGQVVARCESLGVLDRTVIVFTSDNGGLSAHARGAAPDGSTAHRHNAPLRSGKGSAYEGGLRVPFVAAGPGVSARSAPVDVPIVGTDLYPTLLGFAGLKPRDGRACDGADLRGLFSGENAPAERAIVFHQPHKWGPIGPGIEPFTAVRYGRWKLIWFHDPSRAAGAFELYDAATDPAEAAEASAREPARLAAMKALLAEQFTALAAQPSRARADGSPIMPPSGAAAPESSLDRGTAEHPPPTRR